MIHVVFDHRVQIAPHIFTFYFRPQKPVEYVAGQYVELHLPHESADARGQARWFTLSSSPNEELLHITTKITARDGSSLKHALVQLKPGDKLLMTEPMGDFVLPKDPSVPVVFAVGGIGITPVRSMVKWLREAGETRSLQLLYAAHDRDHLIFRDLFETQPLEFIPLLTKLPKTWSGERGPLTAKHILGLKGNAADKLFYFSGPQPMIETLVAELMQAGVQPYQMVLDYFPGYTEL